MFEVFGLAIVLTLGQVGSKSTLEVGVLLELSDYAYSEYRGLYPDILDYAFKEIEERGDILPGFTFNMTVKDTKVWAFKFQFYLFDTMLSFIK